MTAPAPTDAHADAKERFFRAAYQWCADQSCSNALAELEDAFEALGEIEQARLAETLHRRRSSTRPVSSDRPHASHTGR